MTYHYISPMNEAWKNYVHYTEFSSQYKVSLDIAWHSDLFRVTEWIDENLHKWSFVMSEWSSQVTGRLPTTTYTFYFIDETDAMYFTLRWKYELVNV